MAPPADATQRGLTNLHKRLISAAVLLPLVTAAVVLGHPYFTLLIAVFAGVAAWEWARVAANVGTSSVVVPVPNPAVGGWHSTVILPAAIVAVAVVVAGFGASPRRLIAFLVIALLWLAMAALSKNWRRTGWDLLGMTYIALAAGTLVLIRNDPTAGQAALLWIIALVVAADTGGYVAGRSIGGPKLAPRISPNKTWAGLGGAVAGAALVGLLTAFIVNHTNVWVLALLSAVLGVVEQAGDLVESAFKRHFGVKDTSHIIPGHGGVLDRVDGLLAVALAALVIGEWTGRSVLTWS